MGRRRWRLRNDEVRVREAEFDFDDEKEDATLAKSYCGNGASRVWLLGTKQS